MAKEMNKNKRRSSVHNLQVREEIRDLAPLDVFRGVPEFRLDNISRLSGNSLRGSLQSRRGSGIPTPGMSTNPRTTGTSAQVTRPRVQSQQRGGPAIAAAVPPRMGQLLPRKPDIPNRGSVPRPQLGGPIRGSNILLAKTRGVSTSNTNLAASNPRLNSTRRKSKSYESLSLVNTPAFTPSTRRRSQSKSPVGWSTSRRRGILNDGGTEPVKNIKITKDRKIHVEMAKFIYSFLDAQNCQTKPAQFKDLIQPTISGTVFMSIVKFVASHFVGEEFFPKKDNKKGKDDTDIDCVMEVAKILKYPGQLSKSHLKTATVQHAWPSCLTFLAWLCCRLQALLNPPSERRNLDLLSGNDMQEAAFESYLALFPQHFMRTLTNEIVDEELENFKERVYEFNGIEHSKTKEELIQEKREREAELERLRNEVDPAKEFKERFATAVETLAKLEEKIKESKDNLKKYSDTNHLQLEQERIELDIKSKEKEFERLKEQVAAQVFSKHQASALQAETKSLKIQLDSLSSLNVKLQTDFESRNKKVESLRTELYELCSSFSVVEQYNDIVRCLQLEELVIPPNPFAPEELEEWLKTSAKTLRTVETRVNDMLRRVIQSSDQKSKRHLEYTEQIEELRKEIEDKKLKCHQAENYLTFLTSKLDDKYKEEIQKLNVAQNELKAAEEIHERALASKTNSIRNHELWKEQLKRYKDGAKVWTEKLQLELSKFAEEKASLDKCLVDVTLQAAKSQQEFYQEHYGVEVFNLKQFEELCQEAEEDKKTDGNFDRSTATKKN